MTATLETVDALRERPTEVLPDPSALWGPVVFDLETTGLHVDDGHRVAAAGVAYRLACDRDTIWYHSFPFDQGRAADKGFEVRTLPDTPTNRKRNVVGLPAGDTVGEWDWDTDYNLPADEWIAFCKWLRDAGKRQGLSNQNIKFDLLMLRAGTRHWPGVDLERYAVWDTMLANPIVFPYAGTNQLKPVSALLWGEEAVEEAAVVKRGLLEVRKRYGLKPSVDGPRYDLLPWEVNGPYVGADGVLALRLHEYQEDLIAEGVASGTKVDETIRAMRVLCRMERRGLGPYDVQRSGAIADRIDARIESLKSTLPFSPPTGPRAAEYFFDELGMAPWKVSETPRSKIIIPDTRKTAHPGATREKLEAQGDLSAVVARRMATAGVPFAGDWAEITELTIANKMFYRNYVDLAGPDDRIRTSFKQAHVRSGRLSVERFQAQALPKKIKMKLVGELLPEPKSMFLKPAGIRRMNLDLSQAELRIASLFCGCTTMSEAVASGADFHGMTTKGVFHIDESDPEWSLKRDIAKRLTFGSIFRIGAPRFQATLWDLAGIDWPLRDCYNSVNAWRNLYPEFGVAYNEWLSFAERNGYVPLIDGQPSWMLGPRDYPNSAWNRVVQGSLALFAMAWLVEVEKMTAKYDALVLTVHDSVVLDLPEDVADEVCAELAAMTVALWWDWFGIPGRADINEW